MSKIYELDPDADTLIIISQAGRGFALPDPRLRVVNGEGTDHHPSGELRIKASSKHLCLASKPLSSRLAKINSTVQYDGRVHIRLEGFDPGAAKIALSIIHGKASRVPKSLDLKLLAEVAAFVQAWQCHEAIEPYTDRWLTGLANKRPTRYSSEECALWVSVSYVFREPEVFRSVTRLAITQSPGFASLPNAHIPDKVMEAIESHRRKVLGKVVSVIHDIVAELKDEKVFCPAGCDLLLLGFLVRALHQWKLVEPFEGISSEALIRSIRELQDQVWFIGAPSPSNPGSPRESSSAKTPAGQDSKKERFAAHYCGIRSLINPRLYSLGVGTDGLILDDILKV